MGGAAKLSSKVEKTEAKLSKQEANLEKRKAKHAEFTQRLEGKRAKMQAKLQRMESKLAEMHEKKEKALQEAQPEGAVEEQYSSEDEEPAPEAPQQTDVAHLQREIDYKAIGADKSLALAIQDEAAAPEPAAEEAPEAKEQDADPLAHQEPPKPEEKPFSVPADHPYYEQNLALTNMGFTDQIHNIHILAQCDGNLQRTIVQLVEASNI